MLTTETIEKLKASKNWESEAEARKNGANQLVSLIGDCLEDGEMCFLYNLVIERNRCPQDEYPDYLCLNLGYDKMSSHLKHFIDEGFSSAVIKVVEEIKPDAIKNGEKQAVTMIEKELSYASLCKLYERAIGWESSSVAFNLDNTRDIINYDELRPLWVNGCVTDGFFSAVLQMHDQLEAALA